VKVVAVAIATVALAVASAVAGANGSGVAQSTILYQDAASAAPAMSGTPVHLWTTDGNGRHAREVAVLRPPPNGEDFMGARLLADGSVVYARASRDEPNVANIYLLGRGTTRSRLLFAVRGLHLFAPSPDGQRIAYMRVLPVAGKPVLVISRLDGSQPRVIAHAAGNTLSWSADGETLYSYGLFTHCWMCAVAAATGALRDIPLDYRELQGRPTISPSGTRLAFSNLRGPAGERIYTAGEHFYGTSSAPAATMPCGRRTKPVSFCKGRVAASLTSERRPCSPSAMPGRRVWWCWTGNHETAGFNGPAEDT
jgi:hypothetical protein